MTTFEPTTMTTIEVLDCKNLSKASEIFGSENRQKSVENRKALISAVNRGCLSLTVMRVASKIAPKTALKYFLMVFLG